MEQANKLADDAAYEFIDYIHTLIKDISEEEFKAFLNTEDEFVTIEDKLAAIAAYGETHNDIGSVIAMILKT